MAKKTQLGYKEIEQRLSALNQTVDASVVGYLLLLAFGKSEREVSRYIEGKGVVAGFDGLLIKGLLAYQPSDTLHLRDTLEALKQSPTVQRAAPKIVAVSDGRTLLAYDLRERETYENLLSRLHCDFAFFYPLMDIERVRYVEESPADIKAAEKLAKLHDELRAYNDFSSYDDLHDLNIFITRLLFCFFAEDTGIFEEQLFTSSIERYTKPDGSDLSDYLDEAFNIMDRQQRSEDTPHIITQFPYVNGGLFSRRITIPRMGAKARRIILECGELDWKDINPDIFGSMIQAVVNPEERATQGMHYTSVPNIMKVINPLFLDELREAYKAQEEKHHQVEQQFLQEAEMMSVTYGKSNFRTRPEYKSLLRHRQQSKQSVAEECYRLRQRMSRMKFFDPACGSGNFLIIAYKALRQLEIELMKLESLCQADGDAFQFLDVSMISLNQFYGIELMDFPHEVAMLSLWLAEHQMNKKMNEILGVNTRALPLHNIIQIVCGNACRLDWNIVCPHTADEEVFVFGNPPYLGSSLQEKTHKEDMEYAIGKICKYWKKLDYIATWFVLATMFCNSNKAKFAFVSTNSICQGEQVPILWPIIINRGFQISTAYHSFKWNNNARNNAAVMVIIIVLERHPIRKIIISDKEKRNVQNISPYLIDYDDIIVYPSQASISKFQPMIFGSKSSDGGALILTKEERERIICDYPQSIHFIKRYVGADDILNGYQRYCIWVNDNEVENAITIPPLKERFEQCKIMRFSSSKAATRAMAAYSYKFTEIRYKDAPCLVVPRVSSERRTYIPMAYMQNGTVVDGSSQTIYHITSFTFGILTSRMHMTWVRTIGGRLETRYRYSAQLCYNTFPFPKVSEAKKKEIEEAAEEVLITRENYPGQTLAELYDPDTMPQDLREAHARLDDIVESCYPGYPFANDEARLECLFRLYERMTAK